MLRTRVQDPSAEELHRSLHSGLSCRNLGASEHCKWQKLGRAGAKTSQLDAAACAVERSAQPVESPCIMCGAPAQQVNPEAGKTLKLSINPSRLALCLLSFAPEFSLSVSGNLEGLSAARDDSGAFAEDPIPTSRFSCSTAGWSRFRELKASMIG